jgi:hypothetical protein
MSDLMVKIRGMVFIMMTMMIRLSYLNWRPAGDSAIHFGCLFVSFGATASSFTRFLDHTQRRITVGRTPLDE